MLLNVVMRPHALQLQCNGEKYNNLMNKNLDSPRTQISGGVDGVAAVVSEAHSDVKDDEAYVERD